MKILPILAGALFVLSCGSPQPAPTQEEQAQIDAYRATVAIPEGTPETARMQECVRLYATGKLHSFGNSALTRWTLDIAPCLLFGPGKTD